MWQSFWDFSFLGEDFHSFFVFFASWLMWLFRYRKFRRYQPLEAHPAPQSLSARSFSTFLESRRPLATRRGWNKLSRSWRWCRARTPKTSRVEFIFISSIKRLSHRNLHFQSICPAAPRIGEWFRVSATRYRSVLLHSKSTNLHIWKRNSVKEITTPNIKSQRRTFCKQSCSLSTRETSTF